MRAEPSSEHPQPTCLLKGFPGFAVRDGREARLLAPDPAVCGRRASATAKAEYKTKVRSSRSGLLELYYAGDGCGQAVPVSRLFLKLLPPQPGQRIKLGATIIFTRLPLSRDPTLLFQFVQRRVERSVTDLQHIAGDLLQTLADGPAIEGLQRQYFQDQHIQGPLDKV